MIWGEKKLFTGIGTKKTRQNVKFMCRYFKNYTEYQQQSKAQKQLPGHRQGGTQRSISSGFRGLEKPPFFHSLFFLMPLHPRPQAILRWQRQPCQQAPDEPSFCGRGTSSMISGTVAPRGHSEPLSVFFFSALQDSSSF